MTGPDDDEDDMTTLPPHLESLLADVDLADDAAFGAVLTAVADLGQAPPPPPSGELAALLEGTVRPIRGGGGAHRRAITTTTVTIVSVVALSATTAAAMTGAGHDWSTFDLRSWGHNAPAATQEQPSGRQDTVVAEESGSDQSARPSPTDLPQAVSPPVEASSAVQPQRHPALSGAGAEASSGLGHAPATINRGGQSSEHGAQAPGQGSGSLPSATTDIAPSPPPTGLMPQSPEAPAAPPAPVTTPAAKGRPASPGSSGTANLNSANPNATPGKANANANPNAATANPGNANSGKKAKSKPDPAVVSGGAVDPTSPAAVRSGDEADPQD